MPGFRFSETDPFEANWAAFIVSMEAIDADMAGIFRANKDKLASLVRQGNRNAQARADFNASVAKALDALLKPEPEKKI
jgi:hypothetical protein